jgi:hypothetical protein
MKLRTPKHLAIAAITGAIVLTHGIASAQVVGDTYSYFFGGPSQQAADGSAPYDFTNTLASTGYASQTINHQTSVVDTTNGTNGARSPNGVGQNRTSTSIDLGTFTPLVGTGIDGSIETITNVTLLLYVEAQSPIAGIKTFSLYSGLDSTTSPVGSFTVSDADIGSFISIDVPSSVAFSGFTIGNGDNHNPAWVMSTSSEDNSTFNFTPGYRVDTVMTLSVPEPTTALLGGLGALALLRRRRA